MSQSSRLHRALLYWATHLRSRLRKLLPMRLQLVQLLPKRMHLVRQLQQATRSFQPMRLVKHKRQFEFALLRQSSCSHL
jgi:hypothetical protein